MSGQNGLAYTPEAGITWVKDAGQTLLVDGLSGRSWILRGLEAATWDLLALGYSFADLAASLAVLAGTGDAQGRTMLLSILDQWQKMGLVCSTDTRWP